MILRLSRFLKLKSVDLTSLLESSIGLINQAVMLTTNPANGLKILYVNDTFYRQSGYTQEDIKNERLGHWDMDNYTKRS
jgi:PAS domain-containing protein